MRAHIICTAAINGHVSSAVQSSLVPSCAPATEYVAIPEGSSSAAPVITPGPIDFNKERIQRDEEDIGIRKWVSCPVVANHDSKPKCDLSCTPDQTTDGQKGGLQPPDHRLQPTSIAEMRIQQMLALLRWLHYQILG
jgi:hypothetical protein